MISFNKSLSKKFALEMNMFYKIRSITDGFDFIDFNIVYDKYDGDHKPSFLINLILLNFVIFEFQIYNKHHAKENQ
jgi:hypothetical protein